MCVHTSGWWNRHERLFIYISLNTPHPLHTLLSLHTLHTIHITHTSHTTHTTHSTHSTHSPQSTHSTHSAHSTHSRYYTHSTHSTHLGNKPSLCSAMSYMISMFQDTASCSQNSCVMEMFMQRPLCDNEPWNLKASDNAWHGHSQQTRCKHEPKFDEQWCCNQSFGNILPQATLFATPWFIKLWFMVATRMFFKRWFERATLEVKHEH